MAKADQRFGQRDGSDQNFDYMFKLLIIGNSSVGKTSFLFRYADDTFNNSFVSTVGIDFKVKTVYRNDKRVKLQIWVSLSAVWWTCVWCSMFVMLACIDVRHTLHVLPPAWWIYLLRETRIFDLLLPDCSQDFSETESGKDAAVSGAWAEPFSLGKEGWCELLLCLHHRQQWLSWKQHFLLLPGKAMLWTN